ncbi:MAG: RNA polymerase sigma factor [Planctomycetota bacterium]|jgi:RNA polymerase sigma-70 factor (ECF subfamily)
MGSERSWLIGEVVLMADRLLVARCKRGSRDALRDIYEKYRDDLLILAIALSHDVSLAEDAVHDVFVAFAQNITGFKLTGSLKAYLARCVANRVRDLMRTNRSRAKALGPEQTYSVTQDSNEPSRLIVCNEQLQLLSSALAELPYEQREVIVLHIHGQMRFKVIAKSLGVSVNTVKGRYRYGIRKLRSILNSEI